MSGFAGSFVKFATVFALTQVPLAIIEGLVTVVVFTILTNYSRDELRQLPHLAGEVR